MINPVAAGSRTVAGPGQLVLHEGCCDTGGDLGGSQKLLNGGRSAPSESSLSARKNSFFFVFQSWLILENDSSRTIFCHYGDLGDLGNRY